MDEIISSKDSNYGLYEKLLLEKDKLLKEAFKYERAYVKEFGDYILEVFRLKIECIAKKKTIEYCHLMANHGKQVDQLKLQNFLLKEMEEYQKSLDEMIKDNALAKEGQIVSEYDMIQIKKLYHKLAKRMHPDINPRVNDSEILKELWQRIIIAYKCNKLKDLTELEVLAAKALSEEGAEEIDIEIPNLEEKIAELRKDIEGIKSTDPYRYRELLEDSEAVQNKKEALIEEKEEYESYLAQLEAVLDELIGNGVKLKWQMN